MEKNPFPLSGTFKQKSKYIDVGTLTKKKKKLTNLLDYAFM